MIVSVWGSERRVELSGPSRRSAGLRSVGLMIGNRLDRFDQAPCVHLHDVRPGPLPTRRHDPRRAA